MKVLKPKPQKGKGVTVLMNHQIFCTAAPSELDFKFMHQMQFWCDEYKKGVTHNA